MLFDYVVSPLRQTREPPLQIEVAIDPNYFKIEGSNNLSTDDQIRMIQEQEAALKGKLPEEVRDLISMIMPKHASTLAQLDFEYQRRTGKVLFTNWFGSTEDPNNS